MNRIDPFASTILQEPAPREPSHRRQPRESDAPLSQVSVSRDYGATLLITAFALILRLLVALIWASEPVWDGHYYHFGATRLAAGLGYSEDIVRNGHLIWKPWAHYPVGYSFWLSLFYRVFGSHIWVAPVANALVGAVTVFAIHRLAFASLGKTRGRIAAVITALHPGLVVYTAVVMSEPLAAALMVLSALALALMKPRFLAPMVAGLCLGFSVLVRPSSLLALPLLVFLSSGDLRRRVVTLATVTVFCFAAILPWSYRNCRRMDSCVLVSTNAGWNLAIGALTETGRFRPLRATDGCPVVTGQVQQDRCFWDRGMKAIAAHPLRWLKLAPAKLAQTFDHESFAIEYLREANPKEWPEARRVASREWMTFFHRLVFFLSSGSVIALALGKNAHKRLAFYVQGALLLSALIAAYFLFTTVEPPFYAIALAVPLIALLPLPGRPTFGGIVGFSIGWLLLTAVTHIIFFGDDRYHLVVTPLLGLLVASAFRAPKRELDVALSNVGSRHSDEHLR